MDHPKYGKPYYAVETGAQGGVRYVSEEEILREAKERQEADKKSEIFRAQLLETKGREWLDKFDKVGKEGFPIGYCKQQLMLFKTLEVK